MSTRGARWGWGIWALLIVGVLMLVWAWLAPANAQSAMNYWQCVPASPGNPGSWCPVSSGSPIPQSTVGTGNVASGQATVATTATQIAPARTGRAAITIVNEGTTPVRIGVAGVTTGTGFLLPGVLGAALTLQSGSAIYGIVGSGTQAVSYVETF